MSIEILLLSKFKTKKNNEKENILFPNYCMIYVSVNVGDKKKFAKNILTHNEDYHVKGAAQKCKDEKMIMDIYEKELMAREFKTNEKCNKDYTRILYEKRNIKRSNL